MPRHFPRPLNDPKAIDDLLSRQRFDADKTLGDLVNWNIDALEITPDDLTAFLKRRGIEKWSPVDIRPKTAARKAITQVRKDLEQGDLKVLVRRVRENEEEVRYALVDELADRDNATLDYNTRNQAIFNKDAGTLAFTVEPIEEIQERFQHLCGVYTQREANRMIQNIVQGHGGIPMKDGSGMWFMPVAVRHITDALKSLVIEDLLGDERFKGKGFFRVWGILNNEENKEGISKVFEDDIKWELAEAREALLKVVNADTSRPASMRHALDRYKTTAGKARMYQRLLSINLEEIEEDLTKGRTHLETLLGVSPTDDEWDDEDDDNLEEESGEEADDLVAANM